MCRRCDAPDNKYIVQDRRTGLLVCEECGFAVSGLEPGSEKEGAYIWEINPLWPVFHSFNQLIAQITSGGRSAAPPCRPVPGLPSRLLTWCLELLGETGDGLEDDPSGPARSD